MTDSLLRDLKDRLADGFTGTITLHCHQGSVKQFEVHERIRVSDPDGPVHLSEVKGGPPVHADPPLTGPHERL